MALGSSGRITLGTTSLTKVKSSKDDIYKYHPERGISPLAKNSTAVQSSTSTSFQRQKQWYQDLARPLDSPQRVDVQKKELSSPQPVNLVTTNNNVPNTPVDRVKTTMKHFNPVTKEWETEITYTEIPKEESSSESTSDNNNIETAQGETEDKINDTKDKYATATLVYIATPMTITIKPGDTLTLLGLGKYLSGDWLVQDVTRNISSNGYTHQATVYKPDMMTSLKAESTTSKQSDSKTTVSSTDTVNEQGGRILAYTVVQGDNYYSLTKKFKDESHMEYNNLIDQSSGNAIDEKTELKVGQVILIK